MRQHKELKKNEVQVIIESDEGEQPLEENAFALKPIQNNLYFLKSVTINFCSEDESRNGNGLLPRFNRDGLSSTPSFIISQEKGFRHGVEFRSFQVIVEKNKIQQNGIDQLYLPKPTSNYCQVCKQKFQDYLRHVRGDQHNNAMKKSLYQRQIRKFIEDFPKKETKNIKLSPQNIFEEEINEKFEKGRKKVKRSFENIER